MAPILRHSPSSLWWGALARALLPPLQTSAQGMQNGGCRQRRGKTISAEGPGACVCLHRRNHLRDLFLKQPHLYARTAAMFLHDTDRLVNLDFFSESPSLLVAHLCGSENPLSGCAWTSATIETHMSLLCRRVCPGGIRWSWKKRHSDERNSAWMDVKLSKKARKK